MLNYWWVTRPKRKLNSIPDVLNIFTAQTLNHVWNGQRNAHLSLETALEYNNLKRKGDRRDQTGGGARTYKAWLVSLGLIFSQNTTNQIRLTLAGEAIINGVSPVKILTEQVLKYQFPSSYSLGRNIQLSERFKIHPFWFLLKLLSDNRIKWLTQEEIAKIVITEAENETIKCYEYIVNKIIAFRTYGDKCLDKDFFKKYKPSKGTIDIKKPFSFLEDIANTILNWLEYTQLVARENGTVEILKDKYNLVLDIVSTPLPFIPRPEDHEFFQRRYGLDPNHKKDTRNLNNTQTITPKIIAEHHIKQTFISMSLKKPIYKINSDIIDEIAEKTGTTSYLVEDILYKNYPYGAINGFMANYFEMAFKGREQCREFEESTANIFRDVFGFKTKWLGSKYSGKEVPDILLESEQYKFQAIIDTKAYSKYDLPSTQRDRMLYHYLPDINKYSHSNFPLSFFSYIAGGFSNSITTSLNKITNNTSINGSAISITNFIKMIEEHCMHPYTHNEIKTIFSLNREINLNDLKSDDILMVAEKSPHY